MDNQQQVSRSHLFSSFPKVKQAIKRPHSPLSSSPNPPPPLPHNYSTINNPHPSQTQNQVLETTNTQHTLLPYTPPNKHVNDRSPRRLNLASSSRGSRIKTSLVPLYPHAMIDPKLYYKHLPVDLGPVKRMRLLYLWCTRYCAEQVLHHGFSLSLFPDLRPLTVVSNDCKNSEVNNEVSIPLNHPVVLQCLAIIARMVMEKLVNKEIDMDASNAAKDSIAPSPELFRTQPNPINDRKLKEIKQLEYEISIIHKETENWTRIHTSEMDRHAKLVDLYNTIQPFYTDTELHNTLTTDERPLLKQINLNHIACTDELTNALKVHARVPQQIHHRHINRQVHQESVVKARLEFARQIENEFIITPKHLGLHILSALQRRARQS